jgi:hypothetical protein
LKRRQYNNTNIPNNINLFDQTAPTILTIPKVNMEGHSSSKIAIRCILLNGAFEHMQMTLKFTQCENVSKASFTSITPGKERLTQIEIWTSDGYSPTVTVRSLAYGAIVKYTFGDGTIHTRARQGTS